MAIMTKAIIHHLIKENRMSENLQVECMENCGNSPKKNLLKELTIAYAKKDITFCLDWLTDEVTWEVIGKQTVQGKDDVASILQQLNDLHIQQLQIQNIITHGNTGSVNGTITLANQQNIAFNTANLLLKVFR